MQMFLLYPQTVKTAPELGLRAGLLTGILYEGIITGKGGRNVMQEKLSGLRILTTDR